MHLNDILEKSSIKEMTLKTMISEENVEYLVAMEFNKLKKVKTLGFISILEREYDIDLSAMRDEALEYYLNNREGRNYYVNKTIDTEEKKGKSKLFLFILLAGFIYASWYFFTQFDKKHLHELIPFIGEETFENFKSDENISKEDKTIFALSIASIENEVKELEEKELEEKSQDKTLVETMVIDVEKDKTDNNISSSKEDANVSLEAISTEADTKISKEIVEILPISRLWFGIIDIESKKRDHFSIAQPYSLDVTTQSWLVATSSASFSLKQGEEDKVFSDAKEHYFKVSKEEIKELSKEEYVEQGGWSQW